MLQLTFDVIGPKCLSSKKQGLHNYIVMQLHAFNKEKYKPD
jgi:hypothetical protein